MSKWSKIYENQFAAAGSAKNFIEQKISYKKKLLETVEKYCPKNGTILEVGSGSGVTAIHLALSCYKITGIDSDSDMVEFARSIADGQKSAALFRLGNLQTLDNVKSRFDIIFSNGVMEHFSDRDIVEIINRHASVSKYVIFSVPSDFFTDEQRIYGDERFMNATEWRRIIAATKAVCIEEFSFGAAAAPQEKPEFIGFVLTLKPAPTLAGNQADN